MRVAQRSKLAEALVCQQDRRRISTIIPLLEPGYLHRVAGWLARGDTRLLLVTGFLVNGAPETDGPPGARAIADAVLGNGGAVTVVCDQPTSAVVAAAMGDRIPVVAMPIGGDDQSAAWAQNLIGQFNPSVVGFIERCGRSGDGRYYSMHGVDLTNVTARTDHLIRPGLASFAIGDGGNEVGFGRLADALRQRSVTLWPAASIVDELIVASISNWGGYALAAAIAWRQGRPAAKVLPEPAEALARLEELHALGAVDGSSGRCEPKVDGRPFTAEIEIIEALIQAEQTVSGDH